MAKKLILSVDGGGIRGVIPAIVLAELERRLAKQGKTKPLCSYFDLMAGTSTGGIIVAGLSCPKGSSKTTPACDAADLIELYEKEGRDIFDKGLFARLRSLTNPAGIFEERYDAAPLESKLRKRLDNRRVSEALTIVVMTAYDIYNRKAVFITNGKNRDGKPSDDYLFWEAARATSAAPTYFEPAYVFNSTKQQNEALVDGGVFANDPSLAAVIEAKKLGWAEEDLVILSLGTGNNVRHISYAEARNWGALSWINPARGSPIISIFMDGQSSTVSYQMESLFGGTGAGYYRITGNLEHGSDDMDDASPKNLRLLRKDAERIIQENSAKLDKVVARI